MHLLKNPDEWKGPKPAWTFLLHVVNIYQLSGRYLTDGRDICHLPDIIAICQISIINRMSSIWLLPFFPITGFTFYSCFPFFLSSHTLGFYLRFEWQPILAKIRCTYLSFICARKIWWQIQKSRCTINKSHASNKRGGWSLWIKTEDWRVDIFIQKSTILWYGKNSLTKKENMLSTKKKRKIQEKNNKMITINKKEERKWKTH